MNIKSTGLVTLKNSVGYDVFNGKIIRFNATVDINFFPSQVDSISLIKIKERENMPDYKIARRFLKISFNDGTTRYFCVSLRLFKMRSWFYTGGERDMLHDRAKIL